MPVGDFVELAVPIAVTGFIASRVSYRWRDGLWWLVPPVGVAVLVKVAWRLSGRWQP